MTSERLPKPQREGGTPASPAWTIESVRCLGLTTTVDTAASILGISRTKAYALAKHGEFPIKLVRVGRRYLVPIPPLLELLTGERSGW
jgi:excisionase family DNA binding protein